MVRSWWFVWNRNEINQVWKILTILINIFVMVVMIITGKLNRIVIVSLPVWNVHHLEKLEEVGGLLLPTWAQIWVLQIFSAVSWMKNFSKKNGKSNLVKKIFSAVRWRKKILIIHKFLLWPLLKPCWMINRIFDKKNLWWFLCSHGSCI